MKTTSINHMTVLFEGGTRWIGTPVHTEPEPTIVLGNNGVGKTTTFGVLALASLGNIATAFEAPVSEVGFRMRDGSEFRMISVPPTGDNQHNHILTYSPDDDFEAVDDFNEGDAERVDISYTARDGRSRTHAYLSELNTEERSAWLSPEQLAAEAAVTVDQRGRSTKEYLEAVACKHAALSRSITSLLACGYPADFQHNNQLEAPEWVESCLEDNPVRLLGVHRLGIPPSRLVPAQLRSAQETERDTVHQLLSRGSLVGEALQVLDRMLEPDSRRHVVGDAAWQAVDGLFTAPGDAPYKVRNDALVEHLDAYLDERRSRDGIGLSSGERHIYAMFNAVLMILPPRCVILIDEPELSLHVSWQLSIARDLAAAAALRGSRIVLATHSPAIVNDWWDNVVEVS